MLLMTKIFLGYNRTLTKSGGQGRGERRQKGRDKMSAKIVKEKEGW
jgi:hypothetical protein